MSYELLTSVSLGSSNAGKTLAISLFDKNDSLVASGITSHIHEIGNGNYSFDYSSFPDGFRGYGVVCQSGQYPGGNNVLSTFALNPQEGEFIDVKISSISSTTQGTYKVTVTTIDQNSNILPYSTIELYPSGAGSIITKTQTNMSTGSTLFNLNAGDYKIYSYSPTVAVFSNPTYFNVSTDSSFNVTGTTFSPDQPVDPSLIRVYAYIYDLGLAKEPNIQLKITPGVLPESTDISSSGVLFMNEALTSVSDTNGYVYLDVVGNCSVRAKITKAGYDKTFVTPLSGVVNLASLI